MTKKNSYRSDLITEKNNIKFKSNKKIIKKTLKEKNYQYTTIKMPEIYEKNQLIEILKNNILNFINLEKIKNNYHAFVIGIGNDSHTADSIGPKTLKHLKVNSHLQDFGFTLQANKISALEPGVLGETGIDTKRIIESVKDEIKPDIIFIIDSLVTGNIKNLNNTIQITNRGLTPGSGIKNMNGKISKETLGIPVIVIGIPTALEIKLEKNKMDKTYLLSTSDIDLFVKNISEIIGESLNKVFYNF